MKKLYTHENRIILFNLKNLLAEAGITTRVRNEFVGGGIGDLPAFDTWPELWVEDDSRFDEAQSILDQIEENRGRDDWYCRHCQEPNGASFQVCWHCGHAAE